MATRPPSVVRSVVASVVAPRLTIAHAALVALAALVVTALAGAGLALGFDRVAGAAAATNASPLIARHDREAASRHEPRHHPSRDLRGSGEQRSTTTTTAPPTTTTMAPPPPPPPPPVPMFASEQERQHALFVTGQGWGNGDIAPHGLAEAVPGCRLLVPAAPRFHQLLLEAAWAGHHFQINDCYRDLFGQRAMRWDWCVRGSCANAAVPGYSSHGFGVAVDLRLHDRELLPTDAAYAWLHEHGPRFGFRQPDWARPDGPVPEPWHWEYFGPVHRAW